MSLTKRHYRVWSYYVIIVDNIPWVYDVYADITQRRIVTKETFFNFPVGSNPVLLDRVVFIFLDETDLKEAFSFEVLNLRAEIFNFISSALNGTSYDPTEFTLFTKCVLLAKIGTEASHSTLKTLLHEIAPTMDVFHDIQVVYFDNLEADLEEIYVKTLSDQVIPSLLKSISQMNMEVLIRSPAH